MAEGGNQSTQVQKCLDRLQAGDAAARADLLEVALARLRRLAQRMLGDDQRVRRWEDADDVLQNASLRLHRALAEVHPPTVRDFFRLAATQIRRELIDLARRYYGPEGAGAHHASRAASRDDSHSPDVAEPVEETREPSRLAMWSEFHERIETLPSEEKDVFDLLWYQGLTQPEAAALFGIGERTLQRRWKAACERLHRLLRGEAPGW